jgi:sulfopyruvate decarboxylase TPP-binding subunit
MGGFQTRPYGAARMSWSETFLQVLKDNDVRLVTYVPDNVLTPLIRGIHADNYFIPANATREDEAMSIVAPGCGGGPRRRDRKCRMGARRGAFR